jgi:D-sedoheptulose 7-phosphate isomerase
MIAIGDYFKAFYKAVNRISSAELARATELLEATYRRDGVLYAIGNGHSASTASAFALDLSKNSAPMPPGETRRFRVVSLADNVPAITAWANDTFYDHIFSEQLLSYMREGDTLLAISVSGNSSNIISACKWARKNGHDVIGMTGFAGGRVKYLCDVCVIVPSLNYGHVEAAHVAITHYWVDWFREKFAQS